MRYQSSRLPAGHSLPPSCFLIARHVPQAIMFPPDSRNFSTCFLISNWSEVFFVYSTPSPTMKTETVSFLLSAKLANLNTFQLISARLLERMMANFIKPVYHFSVRIRTHLKRL